jgi:myo-inositol-1(or 4)-monophosphatase
MAAREERTIMHPILNIGIRAARAAGDHIMRYAGRVDAIPVNNKGRNDFVSQVDRDAEALIINTVLKAYPDHAILAEESGSRGGGDFQWIIDPLDGTTNYLHGFPQFAVSIAFRNKGEIEQAIIYDPPRQELFTASRGDGARLDNRRIRVAGLRGLENALLGTGVPFRGENRLDRWVEILRLLVPDTAGVRRAGAAALDLAWVACGRLDGFFELGLNTWDIAAGHLLIREAGGIITDLYDRGDGLDSGDVLAGNPHVHKAMRERLALLPR